MKNRKITLLSLLLAMVVVAFEIVTPVRAAENEIVYEPYVVVSSYKVSDDTIIPGKDFKLTLELENTDEKVATRGLLITLSCSEGISTAYGASNQVVISSLEPGEKKEITFELSASPYYGYSLVAFVVNITSEVRSSNANLFAPVRLDLNSFKVVSQSIPEEAEAGEKIAASLSFTSLLGEKLSNVVLSVYIDNESKPVTTANIGNFSAGASKSQNVTFFINEVGRHDLRIELSYNMAEGDSATADLYSGKIMIKEPSEEQFMPGDEVQDNKISSQDKLIILGCLGASILLGIGIVLIAKKYN